MSDFDDLIFDVLALAREEAMNLYGYVDVAGQMGEPDDSE